MNDNDLIQKLEDFKEFLDVGGIFSDPIRNFGWIFIKCLSFILDGLEKVTNEVLLVKTFFKNDEIVAFVDTIRPFLYILLAFSLLYTGYMLIFQKKIEREAIAINIFIAIIIIGLLSTGMEKANDFTDQAIKAVNTAELYDEGEGKLSENILSRHINDLLEFDKKEFGSTEIEKNNTIPLPMISGLKVIEKFDSDELDLSPTGKSISEHYLIWNGSKKDIVEFDQSGLEWNNEYYYRYDINWFSLFVTLGIMAFTLFSIAYKLARLSFELAFNYILAILIAPADVHDGQKTKKVLQSILNTFLVIVLIFVSMKVYIIGTGYLADKTEGITYLIALVAFSLALIDGPNMVERIFGIDAGLKSGWGVAMGALAVGKGVSSMRKGLSNAVSNLRKNGEGKAASPNKNNTGSAISDMKNSGIPSPSLSEEDNDKKSPNETNKNGKSIKGEGNSKNNKNTNSFDDYTAAENGKDSSTSNGISEQIDKNEQNNNKVKAPSPNDADRKQIGQQDNLNKPSTQTDSKNNATTQGMPHGQQQSINDIPPSISGGKDENQKQDQKSTQNSSLQISNDAIQTIEEQQGNSNVKRQRSGGMNGRPQVVNSDFSKSNSNNDGNTSSSDTNNQTRTSEVKPNSRINEDVIINGNEQEVTQGSVKEIASGSGSSSPVEVSVNGNSNSSQSSVSVLDRNIEISDTAQQTVRNVVNKTTDVKNSLNESINNSSLKEYDKIRPEKYNLNNESKKLIKQ